MKLAISISLMTLSAISMAQVPAPVNIRGKVSEIKGNGFVLTSDSGEKMTVTENSGFKLYDRVPSDLSHVKDSSFIGVTTVKQPDGKEKATEIHVFPEEMRGTGEGSRMMTNQGATPGSRMTNGAVSQNRMTNGSISQSRMTNGSASRPGGGAMTVTYAGGAQAVVIPPDVKVTEIKLTPHKLAVGDALGVTAIKKADGSYLADRATLAARP